MVKLPTSERPEVSRRRRAPWWRREPEEGAVPRWKLRVDWCEAGATVSRGEQRGGAVVVVKRRLLRGGIELILGGQRLSEPEVPLLANGDDTAS